MPRASNRVGVEVEVASATPPADLLKAKKTERRARARQRAEEKRLKQEAEAVTTVACSDSAEPAASQSQASEHDHISASSDHPSSQQPVADADAENVSVARRPTARGRLEKLQTPEADEEPAVVIKPEKQTMVATHDELLDKPQHQMAEETANVVLSSLEEARAEFGTEEVINVDAYVYKLSTELSQTLTQPSTSRASTPAQDLDEPGHQQQQHKTKAKTKTKHVQRPTSPDAAAFRIQKALKRKFLKKTLKKCTSFLRHSSKVFAEVDFAAASSLSRPSSSATRSPSPAAVELLNTGSSTCSAGLTETMASEQQSDVKTNQQQHEKAVDTGAKAERLAREQARGKETDPASVEGEKCRNNRTKASEPKKRELRAKSEHAKRSRRRESSSSSSFHGSSSHSRSSSSSSSSDPDEESSSETSSSSRSSRSSRSESSSSSSSSGATSSSTSSVPLSSSDQAPRRKVSEKRPKSRELAKRNKNKDDRKARQDHRCGDESPHDSNALPGPPLDLLHAVVTCDPAGNEEEEPTLSIGSQQQQYDPEAYSYSAVKIQAWLRGVEGRRQALIRRVEFEREIESEALFEVHQEASVRIQAIIRGFLLRRQLGIMNKSPASLRKNGNKAKKKKRRASITAFFKGDDVTQETGPQAQHHQRSTTESFEKRVAAIEEVIEQQQTANSPTRKDSEVNVAEWPAEFNLEQGLDEWEELNSLANLQGDLVTHTHFLKKNKLRVFCGTWNMHAKKPVDDLRLWIPLNKYHIVAVGSEECVNSIAKSVVFTSKKAWEALLKETLGEEYVLVCSHSLTAIHNIVFVHESVLPLLSNIQSDAVATGLGNQLGNKGGVGIAFAIGRTSFAFVNCHFDAHQHNTEKRNGNFHRINQELKLFPQAHGVPITSSLMSPTPTSSAVTGQASLDGLGRTTTSRFSMTSSSNATAQLGKKLAVSECFDRVFWFGDLNYRVNGTRRMVDLLLLHNKHDVLRFNDQLQIEMAKGHVFAHFKEGPLHFRPTYKFDKHSSVYDSSSKQRIPSWTDRILYLSNDKAADIEILSYRSQMTFQTSDHRPVGATFQVNFKANEEQQMLTGESSSSEFGRVLARGYRPSQAKSEVCVVQ